MKENQFISEYSLIHDTLYIIKNLLFGFAMLIKDATVKSPYSMNKKK